MADTLFGREVSGTPLETRGGTSQLAELFQRMLAGGETSVGRMVTGAQRGVLGFDPTSIGTEAAARRALADPADRVRGLFASLEPFEEEQTEQAVAGVRQGFGRLGGRFGRNVAEAESQTRRDVSSGFMRTREEALLGAQGMQIQALAALLQAAATGRGLGLEQLRIISQFLAPGAPNFQEGIAGELIGAAGQAAGAALGAP